MNRKAQLEWGLEFTGKLLIAAAVIFLVIYFGYKLIAIFVSNSHDYTAKKNIELLTDELTYMQKQKETDGSIILSFAASDILVGFDKGKSTVDCSYLLSKSKVPCTITGPCEKCICAYNMNKYKNAIKSADLIAADAFGCKDLPGDIETISGTQDWAKTSAGGLMLNGNPAHYPFVLSGLTPTGEMAPWNVHIKITGTGLLLETIKSTEIRNEKPEYAPADTQPGGNRIAGGQ